LGRKVAAELFGTFMFVLVGAGSAVAAQVIHVTDPGVSLVIAALANGLGLAMAVSATLQLSGGVLNPAVAVGLLVGRKLKVREVIAYGIAEVVGATLAGWVLVFSLPQAAGAAVEWGSPTLSSSVSVAQGITLEAFMTFVLVMAVYGTAVDPRSPKIGGLGIGLAVLADVLVGGPLTGAAMNPARAMGPMLAALFLPGYWYIYWVGPVAGAILAGAVYHYLLEARSS
jgi:MIP family channel proteins